MMARMIAENDISYVSYQLSAIGYRLSAETESRRPSPHRKEHPMDPRVVPLAETLRLNTRRSRTCRAGLTDEQARARPSAAANSAAFVAAHVADSRFFLLKMLGAARPCPLGGDPGGRKAIGETTEWPSRAQVQEAWTEAAHALRDRLAAMTPADLDARADSGFPIEDQSVLGVLTFLVQHDSYHVGQLSLLRKIAGLPAMSYM